MNVLISYANESYMKAQHYLTKTAYRKGKIDKVFEYGPGDIDRDFMNKNYFLLSQKRGAGLWLWKPYIINDALSKLSDGDFLVYCDSGAYCINDFKYLFNIINISKQDILCFDTWSLKEKCYTKPEAFDLMNCNKDEYKETSQRMATIIVCKKSEFSVRFFQEYLYFAQNPRILYDECPDIIRETHQYYINHREDQSVFSLLTKKYNLSAYRNPSQWGKAKGILPTIKQIFKLEHINNPYEYPTIIIVHRCKEVNLITKIKVLYQMIVQNNKQVKRKRL